jgi:TatD family-associated radical SAM protein
MTIAYTHGRGVYLNLTNRCATSCVFCLRGPSFWQFEGHDLRLPPREPTTREAFEAAETLLARHNAEELVFCGYGDSAYRLGAVVSIGEAEGRLRPGLRRRLNTAGLGALIWGRDIAPDLRRGVDEVAVSLNTADPAQWRQLHRPQQKFAARGFEGVLRFVGQCLDAGLDATITAVDQPGVDLGAVEQLSAALGASYRLRPMITAPSKS